MDTRTFELVTSFNAEGFEKYGRRFLETFAAHWPACYRLVVYAENLAFHQTADVRRLISARGPDFAIRDLHTVDRELVDWKDRNGRCDWAHGRFGNTYDYRYDAVRFANKVFALAHAVVHTKADVVTWIDADIVTHTDVPDDFLSALLPDRSEVAYFGRSKRDMYSECGFVMYRTLRDGQRSHGGGIVGLMRQMYLTGQMFQWPEWHDSFVFDVIRKGAEEQVGLVTTDLSGPHADKVHPMIHSPLGAYLDHLKGPVAKDLGHSPASELKVARSEAYWQAIQGEAPTVGDALPIVKTPGVLDGIPGVTEPTDNDRERAMLKRHAMLLTAVEQVSPKRILEIGVRDGVRGAQMALMALRTQAKVHYVGYQAVPDLTAAATRHLEAVKARHAGFTFEIHPVADIRKGGAKRRTADFGFVSGSLDAAGIVSEFEAIASNVPVVVVDNVFRCDGQGRIPDVSVVGANNLVDIDPEFSVMPYGTHVDGGGFAFMALRSDRVVEITGDRVNEIAAAVMHKHLVPEQIEGLSGVVRTGMEPADPESALVPTEDAADAA